jgi:hypothetical protein
MIRADRTILAQNASETGFMGITAIADGQPEPRAIQQALQRGAAVIPIQLMPTSSRRRCSQQAGPFTP